MTELTESVEVCTLSSMAVELEPTEQYVSAPRHYPWSDWMNGRPWRLTMDYPDKPGDFVSEPSTFRTYIYTVARDRGLKVVINIDGDDILLQSYRPGERRPVLPTSRARLRNGRPDPRAPLTDAAAARTAGPVPPEKACRHCGRRLTPAAIIYGECRKFADPDYRCPENPERSEP